MSNLKHTQAEPEANSGRLKELDGLKFLMAVIIVLYHYHWNFTAEDVMLTPFASVLRGIYDNGFLFVETFFVISGFLLAHRYKTTLRQMPSMKYIQRRIRALFPLCIAAVLLTELMALIDHFFYNGFVLNHPIDFYNVFLSITLTNEGWVETSFPGHIFWFMGVLWLCTILYCIVVKASRNEGHYCLLCSAFVLLGWFCIRNNGDTPFFTYLNGRGYCAFFLGALLNEYQILHGPKERKLFSTIIALLLLLLIALSYLFSIWTVVGDIILVWPLFIAPGTVLAVLNVPILSRLFGAKPLVVASKISMSVFLFQNFAFYLIKLLNYAFHLELDYSTYPVFAMVFGSVTVISILAHVLLEKRLIPYLLGKLDALRALDQRASTEAEVEGSSDYNK